MNKSVLFVSDKESFLQSTIMKSLQGSHIVCERARYDESDITKNLGDATVVFMEVNLKTVNEYSNIVSYLVLLCDQGIFNKMILMGEKPGLDATKQLINRPELVESFMRPVNIVDITNSILKALGGFDSAQSQATDVRKRILVVDDNTTFLYAIQSWLKIEFKVDLVTSAMDAIKYLSTNSPDLLLLDYEMPVMDGCELLSLMKNDPNAPQVPVVFLTGKNDIDSVKRVVSLNADGYLLKSLPPEDILNSVREFAYKE